MVCGSMFHGFTVSVVSWLHGFVVSWFRGFVVSWFHGFIGFVVSLVTWLYWFHCFTSFVVS